MFLLKAMLTLTTMCLTLPTAARDVPVTRESKDPTYTSLPDPSYMAVRRDIQREFGPNSTEKLDIAYRNLLKANGRAPTMSEVFHLASEDLSDKEINSADLLGGGLCLLAVYSIVLKSYAGNERLPPIRTWFRKQKCENQTERVGALKEILSRPRQESPRTTSGTAT